MTELGSKHECLSCGTKFYDLGKSEIVCPKCGAHQKELAEAEAAEPRKKTSKRTSQAKKKKKKRKADAKEEIGTEEA